MEASILIVKSRFEVLQHKSLFVFALNKLTLIFQLSAANVLPFNLLLIRNKKMLKRNNGTVEMKRTRM